MIKNKTNISVDNTRMPEYHETFTPILIVLNEMGTMKPNELKTTVRDRYYSKLSNDLLNQKTKEGNLIIMEKISWGMFELGKAKMVEKPERGKIGITLKGKRIMNSKGTYTHEDIRLDEDKIAHNKNQSTNKGGTNSKYSGKRIYKLVQNNPRRLGTLGNRSFELYEDGMTYEEYIAKGGEYKHLRWDLGYRFDGSRASPFIELRDDNEPVVKPRENNTSVKNAIDAHPLNQILYGPPGTGKTYETTRLAVEIATQEKRSNDPKDRADVIKEYQRLMEAGRIEFVTFHQSYGYEDFVEGIKPRLGKDNTNNSRDVSYHIKDGIFKRICIEANPIKKLDKRIQKLEEFEPNDYAESKVWMMRLGDGGKYNDDCFNNNFICMGWSDTGDLSEPGRYERMKIEYPTAIKSKQGHLGIFYEEMKVNDIVIVPDTNKHILALGILGPYRYDSNISEEGYSHKRSVNWIFTKINKSEKSFNVYNISNQKLSPKTVCKYPYIKPNDLINSVKSHCQSEYKESMPSNKESYIIIIDEINRGNISKILGELITLIEKDKRKGATEELEVTLPYSGEKFSVPNNLYIIGTMNTADRSIAFLDTALRRRFQFEEVMPNYDLVDTKVGGIDLSEVLRTINKGIKQKLDRDHQIGHSYFMGDQVKTLEGLAKVFRNSICPLLDEYFYDRRDIIPEILNHSNLIDADSKDWNYAVFEDTANYKKIYKDNANK